MDSIAITRQPITPADSARLTGLEAVIDSGLRTFVDVGAALLEIRESRLYRQTHGTFEDYCRERWQMVASRARQLIAAVETVRNLESVTTVTPATESQARPLAPLPPEQQRQAWTQAMETARAADRPVTAKDVQAAAEAVTGKVPAAPAQTQPTEPATAPAASLPASWKAGDSMIFGTASATTDDHNICIALAFPRQDRPGCADLFLLLALGGDLCSCRRPIYPSGIGLFCDYVFPFARIDWREEPYDAYAMRLHAGFATIRDAPRLPDSFADMQDELARRRLIAQELRRAELGTMNADAMAKGG
jgi:hypothetical protein